MIWNLNSVGHSTQGVEMELEWQEKEFTELLKFCKLFYTYMPLKWAYNDEYKNDIIWI